VTSGTSSKRRGSRFTPHQIIAIVLGLAALIFVFQNREETEIRFLNGTFQAPLWTVLLILLLIGFIMGWFLQRRR
jgi:uncharacterized integral membrane protein